MTHFADARDNRYVLTKAAGRLAQMELLEDMGKPVIRASRAGLGIGLLLSHATVERFGGRIELHNASDGGTLATLVLPLPKGESHD